MTLDIHHDPGGGRFFASIGGEEATLLYTEAGAGTLDFTHTYVPDALRHRNIGEAIVKHALALRQRERLRGHPHLPFCEVGAGEGGGIGWPWYRI